MTLDKRNLFRLPWSMNDNPIAWLEVTDICNIHCEGCYRQHMTGHKTLEQVKEEAGSLDVGRSEECTQASGVQAWRPFWHKQAAVARFHQRVEDVLQDVFGVARIGHAPANEAAQPRPLPIHDVGELFVLSGRHRLEARRFLHLLL